MHPLWVDILEVIYFLSFIAPPLSDRPFSLHMTRRLEQKITPFSYNLV